MSNILRQFRSWLIQPKILIAWLVLLGLVLYVLGLEWALIIISLGLIASFLPMPRVIESWFSRLLVALLFVYSLLQVAAVIQFLIWPAGKFRFIALIFGILLAILLLLFGSAKPLTFKIIRIKDVWALVACIFFLLPFSPILIGNHSAERITKIGSVQIVDSIAHYSSISDYSVTQNLNYKKRGYYPSGFQISTSFIQYSFFGDNEHHSWRFHAYLYFGQYIFFGLLLVLVLVYLGYAVLFDMAGLSPGPIAYLAVALTIGSVVTLTDLWLFINEGFLNYYYIVATLMAALLYVFDSAIVFVQFVISTKLADKWPLLAFLILTIGASFSWPLLILPIMLAAGTWLIQCLPSDNKKWLRSIFQVAHLPILAVLLFHLLAVYFQLHYSVAGQYNINANGGLHSFNIPLLIIGSLVFTFALFWRKPTPTFHKALMVTFVPYFILVGGLMAIQYFTLGEVRYYAMKSAEPLEMLFITLGAATLVYGLIQRNVNELLIILLAPALTLFIVVGTIGILPQPFREVRDLFRDYSHTGKPPYLDVDARLLANLGVQGKIVNFNASAIHYDPSSGHFLAHPETAIWANAMATLTANRGAGSCFDNQLVLLAYTPASVDQQKSLKQVLKDCITTAKAQGLNYYIVTDASSVTALRAWFGDSARLVY